MSKDSTARVLGVAFVLCLVCSVLVSVAAVGLSERQQRNKLIEKRKNILQAAGLYQPEVPIEEQFKKIQPRIVDLQTGKFTDQFDPATFDSRAVARDPQLSDRIPPAQDLAAIKVRPRFMDVYLVFDAEHFQQLILPVYGKGLWSTMHGFIALDKDLTTVNGFAFYEHGETPGLGGEVDNPAWKQQWPGKKIYGPEGRLRIEVLKGKVDPASPIAVYQADGLAGATLTARGVSHLLQYWLGENGYRTFFAQLKQEGVNP